MSSSDLKGDVVAVFNEHGNRILAVGTVLVVVALLLGLLGFGNVLGGVFFLGYSLLWLAVVAFVLWLFYRLVVAVERIADAQERIASAQFQAEPEEESTSRKSGGDATSGEDEVEGDEPAADDDADESV